jgi:hypothetical protein
MARLCNLVKIRFSGSLQLYLGEELTLTNFSVVRHHDG